MGWIPAAGRSRKVFIRGGNSNGFSFRTCLLLFLPIPPNSAPPATCMLTWTVLTRGAGRAGKPARIAQTSHISDKHSWYQPGLPSADQQWLEERGAEGRDWGQHMRRSAQHLQRKHEGADEKIHEKRLKREGKTPLQVAHLSDCHRWGRPADGFVSGCFRSLLLCQTKYIACYTSERIN